MTWIVVGVVLVTAVAGAVFFHPVMQAVGAEVTGAPTTVAPSLMMPAEVPSATPTADGGPVGEAAAAAPGDKPAAALFKPNKSFAQAGRAQSAINTLAK